MNGKNSKKLRSMAKQICETTHSYLNKPATKMFTDFSGNTFPYNTNQTVLHPKSEKYVLKLLKKLRHDKDVFSLSFDKLKAFVQLETEARLSELQEQGYKAL